MRTLADMVGDEDAASIAGGPVAGVRPTPGYHPTPNNVPAGAKTGAPPRTRFFSRVVIPASAVGAPGANNVPSKIVEGTPENRVAFITAPLSSSTVYIGDAGVTPETGLALPAGMPYEAVLPGLQDLYAVTDSPTYTRVQVQVSIVLASEQARRV